MSPLFSRFKSVLTLAIVLCLSAVLIGTARAGTITVTNINDAGAGSLRDALAQANANPGGDTIKFNIPGAGPFVIEPLTALPATTGQIKIDASTQPNYAGTPLITINGAKAGAGVNGLTANGGIFKVVGLKIEKFKGDGLKLNNCDASEVKQCEIQGQDGHACNTNGGAGLNFVDNFCHDNAGAGLVITGGATNCSIGTSIFGDNDDYGIGIFGEVSDVRVYGNVIGLIDGAAAPNEGGILVQDASGILIGGPGALPAPPTNPPPPGSFYVPGGPPSPASFPNLGGNVIAGNTGNGIFVSVGSENVKIRSNYIGVNAAGTAFPNAQNGISVISQDGILIGGTGVGTGNLISGNTQNGVNLVGPSLEDVTISGNFIGTNPTGTAAVPNGGNGISNFGTTGVTIGGSTKGSCNLISGNTANGIGISGPATGNHVLGNLIGTDLTGKGALGNDLMGTSLTASNNFIGGPGSGQGNVISGNAKSGVELAFPSTSGNQILGNFIGTDSLATAKVGNLGDGVNINGAQAGIIGGSTPGSGNVIVNSGLAGVELFGAVQNTIVRGNLIGTNAAGDDMGNGYGVVLGGDDFSGLASNNTIGGIAAGAGNRIAFNGVGINAYGGASCTGNSWRGNFIYDNDGLGIDLSTNGDSGVAPNDAKDADAGTNEIQNYPVLETSLASGGILTAAGSFNSEVNKEYTLDFYTGPAKDPSGFGEGKTWRGTFKVTTDANGNATFSHSFDADIPSGHFLTATATSPSGSTSEFSAAIGIVFEFKLKGNVARYGGGGKPIGVPGVTVSRGSGNSVLTDANGNFVMRNLPPGTYDLSAAKTGFTFSPDVTHITVVNSDQLNIKFHTYAIYGVVQSAAGKPLSGISVTLSGPAGATVATDENGAYNFQHLGAGNYTVTPSGMFSPSAKSVTLPSENGPRTPNGTANFTRQTATGSVAPSAPDS